MTDPLRSFEQPDKVAAAIERHQASQIGRTQPRATGPKTIVTSEGVFMEDAQGKTRPVPPSPAQQLARDVTSALAAFELAVVEDFSTAMDAYLAWTDQMHRSNTLGGDRFADIPPFSVAVDQAAAKAAIARRR